jgi:hypothetical protein
MGFLLKIHQLPFIGCYLVPGFYTIKRLDLFTVVSSPRKFAECLYCDVSLPPILPILSCFIESPAIYSSYSHTSHIHTFTHTFIQSYIDTLILSHICIVMYFHLHATYPPHHSYMVASVTHSLGWSYPFNSVFTYHLVQVNHLQISFMLVGPG